MIISEQLDLQKEIAYINDLLQKNGPDKADYPTLDLWYQRVWNNYGTDEKAIGEIRKALSIVYNDPKSLFGLVYSAPHGYKGDFEIIDRIYQNDISTLPHLKKWDDYFQNCIKAPKAVRNRKAYFKRILNGKSLLNKEQTVLNLASGPCRGLKEFFEIHPTSSFYFDCVELDENAIQYAKDLTNHNAQIHFIHQNIFRFKTEKQYDLIWSAGLFDYFDDATFSKLLKRFIKNVKVGGEIILGNFHPSNPTRHCMEVTAWHLYHRTEDQLRQLAKVAGIQDQSRITIEQEAEGVNLFMRIKF